MKTANTPSNAQAGARPNSREYFYLKLLEEGADEVMTLAKAATLLGVRPRTLYGALAKGQLSLIPAVSLDELSLWLYRDPGLVPKLMTAPQRQTSLTADQLCRIDQIARQKVEQYPHLGLEPAQFSRAVITAFLRSSGTDWQSSISQIADRLIEKLLRQ